MTDMPSAETADEPRAVSFFFDPSCPWTWMTSRWLLEVAAARRFPIAWRSFSVALADEGGDVPATQQETHLAGAAALRLIEALLAEGRNDDVGRFYTELGRRWHHDREPRTADSISSAADLAGVGDVTGAIEDEGWDAAVRKSFERAVEMAGPDVGSPVLAIGDAAMFGPIVSPPPTGADALALWDAVSTMIPMGSVYELKRGRRGRPHLGPRPADPGS
jgi:2-hydroxychromene-2-carboxylate isomerase